jgi:hypothetical protein
MTGLLNSALLGMQGQQQCLQAPAVPEIIAHYVIVWWCSPACALCCDLLLPAGAPVRELLATSTNTDVNPDGPDDTSFTAADVAAEVCNFKSSMAPSADKSGDDRRRQLLMTSDSTSSSSSSSNAVTQMVLMIPHSQQQMLLRECATLEAAWQPVQASRVMTGVS